MQASLLILPNFVLIVMCAALPTASNAYILAVRMTGDGSAVALANAT